jgi:hypothetical protein
VITVADIINAIGRIEMMKSQYLREQLSSLTTSSWREGLFSSFLPSYQRTNPWSLAGYIVLVHQLLLEAILSLHQHMVFLSLGKNHFDEELINGPEWVEPLTRAP